MALAYDVATTSGPRCDDFVCLLGFANTTYTKIKLFLKEQFDQLFWTQSNGILFKILEK